MLNNPQRMLLKLFQKGEFKKQQKELVHRIVKVSTSSPQNNSEAIKNEHEKKYIKKIISPKDRQKIIDNLRLVS